VPPDNEVTSLGAIGEGDHRGPAVFTTTHWSVVLEAQGESPAAREALEKLCRTYWRPIYSFVRRQGARTDDSEDLTQGFFALLLERKDLNSVRKEKGRLRSYLLTSLKNFLTDERRRVMLVPGLIFLIIDPNENLTGAIFEGLDYEAIYILDSAIFGHGDFGRLTATLNGTWLSRAELQISPDTKRFGIAGEVIPPGFTLTGSLPWNRANFSLFYDGPTDTWLQGLDIGAIVHYTGQYEDDNQTLTTNFSSVGFTKPQTPRSGPLPWRARKVREWITLDLIASYTFNSPPLAPAEVPGLAKDGGKNFKMKDGKEKNVVPVSTAEYNPCGWRAWLNNTTITLGMQNVFDEDPPFVAGNAENGYDESLATIKGRFWYVQLKKKF
jgi:hypothetical protein